MHGSPQVVNTIVHQLVHKHRAEPPREGVRTMHCPFCRHTDSRVMDSRATDDGSSIRRRRQCPECGRRFTTVETASLTRRQALRRHRAVQPRQGPRRRPQGLPGPPGHRGRPRPPRPARRGDHPQPGQRRDRRARGRPGRPRAAARARRGRLPALRLRLPGLRLPRGLRVRHHPPARRARRDWARSRRAGCRPPSRGGVGRRSRLTGIRSNAPAPTGTTAVSAGQQPCRTPAGQSEQVTTAPGAGQKEGTA